MPGDARASEVAARHASDVFNFVATDATTGAGGGGGSGSGAAVAAAAAAAAAAGRQPLLPLSRLSDFLCALGHFAPHAALRAMAADVRCERRLHLTSGGRSHLTSHANAAATAVASTEGSLSVAARSVLLAEGGSSQRDDFSATADADADADGEGRGGADGELISLEEALRLHVCYRPSLRLAVPSSPMLSTSAR